MKFTWDSGKIAERSGDLPYKAKREISGIVEYYASKGEGELKTRAPWTDRTGAARSGLHTNTIHSDRQWILIFAHLVTYGVWLETSNSGRYAVILPVMRFIGQELMKSLDGMFSRLN